MPRAASPRRYAQAVFQIALEGGRLEAWAEDLRVLAVALENRELAVLLDAPQVTAANKIDTIKEVLGGSVEPLAANLLCLLGTRNLAHILPGVVDEYNRLLDVHGGIEQAEVVAAVSLEDDQQRRISDLLKDIVGKDIRLTSYVDQQLLGGLVARVGDRVIDGSLRAKLAQMRRDLVGQAS